MLLAYIPNSTHPVYPSHQTINKVPHAPYDKDSCPGDPYPPPALDLGNPVRRTLDRLDET